MGVRGLAQFALRALLLALTGCALLKLSKDNARLDRFVDLRGEVKVENWSGAPLVISLLRAPSGPGTPIVIERHVALEEPGRFSFRVPSGRYQLAAYEDRNRSFRLEAGLGERGGVYRGFRPFKLEPGGAPNHAEVLISDELPDVLNELESATYARSNMFREGQVVALGDARFEPGHASTGVWQPLTYAERLGMGVFMLEPYARDRIPVVFIHGMGGHPREFAALIGCLDKQRYQAWVVQYPSGWRLAPLALDLHRALQELHLRHGFSELHIVAHSMGGLLSRRLLQEHAERRQKPFITRLITLASPLGGVPSADKGVQHSPAVVPAWRDIGTRSAFVRNLYLKPLPRSIEYTLFFVYDRNDSGAVIRPSSQLRREAQQEATRVLGFETTHQRILANKAVCAELNHPMHESAVKPAIDLARVGFSP
jgi:pimeloyl-ACP methyl ester carboxylesterase